MKFGKKVQTYKRYKNQIKVMKLEGKAQNSKSRYKISMKICETKKRNVFISFTKQLETLYFVFRETIETRQNSDLFCTVLYFAKLKKNTKLSTVTYRDTTC